MQKNKRSNVSALSALSTCILWLYSLVSYAGAAEVMKVTVAANKPRFIITLPSNPSTGYTWVVTHYDNLKLRLISSKFQVTKTGLVGAPGKMNFVFARIPKYMPTLRHTQISFAYLRPWEHQSVKTQDVEVFFMTSSDASLKGR